MHARCCNRKATSAPPQVPLAYFVLVRCTCLLQEISIRSRKCFIQGRTPEGHPIIYLRAGLHDTSKVEVEETKRFVIFVLEHALHLTGHTNESKFVVIADFADFGYAGFDREAVNFILKMLSLNYPERLRQLYIVNEGWLFWCLWKLVGPFLDERTSRKIHMLSQDFTMMHEDLGKDNLLEDYGGNLECNYDPDAWCDGERAEDRDAPHATTAGESAAAGGGKDGVPSQDVGGERTVAERDNSG